MSRVPHQANREQGCSQGTHGARTWGGEGDLGREGPKAPAPLQQAPPSTMGLSLSVSETHGEKKTPPTTACTCPLVKQPCTLHGGGGHLSELPSANVQCNTSSKHRIANKKPSKAPCPNKTHHYHITITTCEEKASNSFFLIYGC